MEHSASAFESVSHGRNVSVAVFAVEQARYVKYLTTVPFDIAFIAPNNDIHRNDDNSISITPGVYSVHAQGKVSSTGKFRLRFRVDPSSQDSKLITTFTFNEYGNVNINCTGTIFAETNSLVNLIFIGTKDDEIKVHSGFKMTVSKM
jgi:hypothetical protein